MSSLNYMEKLLDGVAVEWKSLGEIGEFVRGKLRANVLCSSYFFTAP